MSQNETKFEIANSLYMRFWRVLYCTNCTELSFSENDNEENPMVLADLPRQPKQGGQGMRMFLIRRFH